MSKNIQFLNSLKTLLELLYFLIALFTLGLIFNSCATKPIENTHTIERVIEHHTDSVKSTEINKAIIDSLMIQIAKVKTAKPDCDSITQATVDQLLQQLNRRKKSGDNEAGIHYDDLKKELVIWQKMAETKNENVATNKVKIVTQIDKQFVKVPVRYIPLWVKILAFIGFGFLVFVGYRIARIWF
ncbi:hypothetical protein [Flavobacterium aestivum]|uniref:hypothetical protein n=1 Tax=Flavobacterium aestivum TaxID=3003257 RepID=UPI002286B2E3|nr:hypothetical protein [Flavobacterium aestivum]